VSLGSHVHNLILTNNFGKQKM